VVQLLETAISVMGCLRRALERREELVTVLEKHDLELKNLKSLVQTVQNEDDLRTDPAIDLELEKLKTIEGDLVNHLHQIDPEGKGKVQQFTHQLFHGSKEERKLANIMNGLSRAKLDLSFRVQVASVGVIRDVGAAVFVNAETINRIDRCLRNLLGEGKGLRIAKLLRDDCPKGLPLPYRPKSVHRLRSADQNGNFRLNRADVDEALEYDEENKKSEHGPGYFVHEKVRKMNNNTAERNSMVFAAPIIRDSWAHMDLIEASGNKALDNSCVFAFPITAEGVGYTQYLLDRQERMADKQRLAAKEEREAERGSMNSKDCFL
jgi:hypothetical protein